MVLAMTSDGLTKTPPPATVFPAIPAGADTRSVRSIRREVLRLAWPAMLEMVLHMSVWVVDVIMVGRLGANALAVTGFCGQVYWPVVFFVGGVGVAVTAIVSRRVGAGLGQKAAEAGTQGLLVALGAGVLVSLGLWLAAPAILALTRLGPEVTTLGVAYLRIICFGAPFLVSALALAGVLRGYGDTRTPMLIVALMNVMNIFLCYSLIYGKFGLPALGVLGSAVAALSAQVAGTLAFLALIAGGKVGVRIDLGVILRPDWAEIGGIVRLAVPAGMESFFVDLARIAGLVVITSLGPVSVAAHEVAAVTESLSFMPGFGLAVATSIVVGQSLGRNDPARAKAGVREGALLGLALMSVMGIIFFVIPGPLVRIFTNDPAIIAVATKCLRVVAVAQPVMAIQGALAGALRGAGDTRTPMLIGLVTSWGCRFTLTLLVVFGLHRPLPWVWGVMVVDGILKLILTAMVYRRGRWLRMEI
jgi:putative MATE family efflux protein